VQVAEDDGVVAVGLREDFVGADDAVEGGVGLDVDFSEEFEDDLIKIVSDRTRDVLWVCVDLPSD